MHPYANTEIKTIVKSITAEHAVMY